MTRGIASGESIVWHIGIKISSQEIEQVRDRMILAAKSGIRGEIPLKGTVAFVPWNDATGRLVTVE